MQSPRGSLPPWIGGEGESAGPQVTSPLPDASLRIFAKSSDTALWETSVSYGRKAALKKWLSLMAIEPASWLVARRCMLSIQFGQGSLTESLKDALADRATSTLHSRASPLLRYAKFCADAGFAPFPIQEGAVYAFVKASEDSAPTFPRSFLISLSFSGHLLGLVGSADAVGSGRIRGAVSAHYVRRRKVRRRPPLTLVQISALVTVLRDEARSIHDRVAAGHFLFMVYGRLRYSDSQNVSSMRLDVVQTSSGLQGYLECTADHTKTSVSLQRKITALPVVIPLIGPTEEPWVPIYLEVRKQAGLPGEGDSIKSPMLPSPTHTGGWSKAPLSGGAAAEWLRHLLQGTDTVGHVRLGTHSCKCTLLSWMAKAGAGSPSDRRLLGYHVAGRDTSMVIYSRDAMATPMRVLDRLLLQVQRGTFLPDETRSGRFVRDASSSESSSIASDDEEDAEDDEHEEAAAAVVGDWPPKEAQRKLQLPSDEAKYVRRRTSRCIHVMRDEAGSHLQCGRKISTAMEVLSSRPPFLHPACLVCFALGKDDP